MKRRLGRSLKSPSRGIGAFLELVQSQARHIYEGNYLRMATLLLGSFMALNAAALPEASQASLKMEHPQRLSLE